MAFWNRKNKSERIEPTVSGKRYFDASVSNRLTGNFSQAATSTDNASRWTLDKIRARSRELARNSDYAKKFLRMVQVNVVGPEGFTLKAKVKDPNGKPDVAANQAIQNAFWEWSSKRYCDVVGRMSFPHMCRVIARMVERDGEVLVQKIRARGINPFGYSLRILDIDRLDTNFNGQLSNGNRVSMGVEMDDLGRAVAYHLFSEHPNDHLGQRMGQQKRARVPADEMFHVFEQHDPEQTRGIPSMHTAIMRLHHIKGFEEATVIAARIGASKMGWFTAPEGDPAGGDASLLATKDADGQFAQSVEPGVLDVLPAGYGFQAFNPDYPSATYDPFMKRNLQAAAAGLEVAYHHLANDLEGVNFSSIRAGTLEEREIWKTKQSVIIDVFLTPMISEWLSQALLMNAIKTANGNPLPATKLNKFDSCIWRGRRWSWVDPLKDIEASAKALDLKLISRAELAADQGRDIEDVWQELAEEDDLALKLNIDLTPPAPAGFLSPGKTQNDQTSA